MKAGDIIRYGYKNDIGIAKLVDINGELCITVQRSSDKIDVGEEILKLKDVTDVHLLSENEIKKQLKTSEDNSSISLFLRVHYTQWSL